MESIENSVSGSLHVTPQTTLIDESVDISLSGLTPGQSVKIQAETRDGTLKRWVSHATFVVDPQGNINVGTQELVEGSYSGIDSMGLFWSMSPEETKRPTFFTKTKVTPLTVTFSAEVDGATIVTTSIERVFASPGVTITPVQESGIIGTFFLPPTPGPHPAAIILNGSDGGMHENAGALLASRGYAALTLAYFGIEDVPREMLNIPLEYFEKAIHWLQKQVQVVPEKIAVIGLSRGGELALLLAATFPAISAVVAGAPSSIVYGGPKGNNSSRMLSPAWTYHNKPLPFLPYKQTLFSSLSFFWKYLTHKPISNRSTFLKSLQQTQEAAEATIPVERIQGPVLLISGQQDQLWPSDHYAKTVLERLRSHNHPYPVQHLNYPEVGHFVCFPYSFPSLPPMIMLSPLPGLFIAFGGIPSKQAAAAIDSWQEILAFLKKSL